MGWERVETDENQVDATTEQTNSAGLLLAVAAVVGVAAVEVEWAVAEEEPLHHRSYVTGNRDGIPCRKEVSGRTWETEVDAGTPDETHETKEAGDGRWV